MTLKEKNLRPKFKLWLSSPEAEGIFGDGKWRLLKAVSLEGSLLAATQCLKISYRKAWGDLRKAEQRLGERLVEKHRGGAEGGTALLTETGKAWLKAYAGFRSDVEKAVSEAFTSNIAPLLHRRKSE